MLGRQYVNVFSIDSYPSGLVVENIYLLRALFKRYGIGCFRLLEFFNKLFGLVVVEIADSFPRSLECFIDGRVVAHWCLCDCSTKYFSCRCNTVQKRCINGSSAAELDHVIALGVKLSIRKRIGFDFC